MKKRLCAILLVLAIVLAILPVSAAAASPQRPDLLALGDSITYGTGLQPQMEKRFTALLDPYYGNVVNKGVDGNTAPGLLQQFADGTVTDEEIRAAEIITVTCGGNDLMAVLYDKMVACWNAEHPKTPLASTDITKIFGGEIETSLSTKISLIQFALNLMNRDNKDYLMTSPEFLQGLDDFIVNINQVMAHLHAVNPDAKILLATQYNPYVEFKDKVLSVFIARFNLYLLYEGMEDGTTQLNDRIRANAAAGGYTVVEVKAAFDRYTGTGDLYQANYSNNFDEFSVDFHPAEEGHAVLAETIRKSIAVVDLVPNWEGGEVTTLILDAGAVLPEVPAPTRDGYLFRGWYTGADPETLFDLTQPIPSDVALYAKWTPVTSLGASGLQITGDDRLLTEHLDQNAAFLLIAAYDETLQMTDCQYEALIGSANELEISVSGETRKIFLLNRNYVPICAPIPVPSAFTLQT